MIGEAVGVEGTESGLRRPGEMPGEMPGGRRARWGILWQVPLLGVTLAGWGVFLVLVSAAPWSKEGERGLASARVGRAFERGEYEKALRYAALFAETYPQASDLGDVKLWGGRAALRLAEATPNRSSEFYRTAGTLMKEALGTTLDEAKSLLAMEGLGRSYLCQGDYRGAGDVLEEADRRFPERSRSLLLLLARARFLAGLADAGRACVAEYLQAADVTDEEKAEAYLELAEGCLVTGALRDAERNFRQVISEFPMSAKVKRAHFGLAETLLEMSRTGANLLDEARGEFESVVRMLPADEALDRKAAYLAGECLNEKKEYGASVRVVGGPEAVERGAAAQVGSPYEQGRLVRRAAEGLASEAVELRGRGLLREAVNKEEQARADFGRAARLFVRVLGDVETSGEVHERTLLLACECFERAQEYARAAACYRILVKSAGTSEAAVAIRLRYAAALQALGRHREALGELDWCISRCGNSPAVYEAMLAKARSCVALSDFEAADATLSEIVRREDMLSPTGKTWEEALVRLGYVLYREGKFDQAAVRFDEALARKVPSASGGLSRREMAYYLAESYRSIGSTEPSRWRADLRAAARWYGEVHASLDQTGAPSALEDRMIRRSYVAEGDCRCQVGDYDGALRVYDDAVEKYLEGVEGVGALFGKATCLHELGDASGALEACKRARWGLERLKSNQPDQVPRFLEECWGAMTAWSVLEEGS